MNLPLRPALQYRWQIGESKNRPVLVYYGLRNPPQHLQLVLEIAPEIAGAIASLDGRSGLADLPDTLTSHPQFARLAQEGVIVDASDVRRPATRQDHRQCVRCVNDDYLLPGLEFDGERPVRLLPMLRTGGEGRSIPRTSELRHRRGTP